MGLAAVNPPAVAHRGAITVSVMLATIMQALDTTIANVALPHMQGDMGATQDQISWVLTSYIVASAIVMLLTGFISARVGRKRTFMVSVIGFTLASMLCGAAQSLEQIVLFRLLQGVFGASLVPLSQSVLLDAYPREKAGAAMAMWGVGVMIGPILGPSLGGWLTEMYNWRWVFYINLPIGILTGLGLALYVSETPRDPQRRFDLTGFALLALSLACLQLLLDRGHTLDWFNSMEITLEATVAVTAFAMFLVHIFTRTHTIVEPALFRDRNYTVGLAFMFVVGIILLATMALLPPLMQGVMGYKIVDIGLLLAPRGVGTMVTMMIAGRLTGRISPRRMIVAGLGCTALSMWDMTHFGPFVQAWDIVRSGLIQGAGLGLMFVPLSTVAFSTLPARYRNEATALFSLVRNIGSSIGISLVITYWAHRVQANHAELSEFIHPYAWAMQHGAGLDHLNAAQSLALINAEVSRQAAAMAYLQDFHLMMWVTLAALPLALLLRDPRQAGPSVARD